MIIPLKIELTSTWKEISTDIFNLFNTGDSIDMYFRLKDSKVFEVLIDTSGVLVINDTYNNQGLRVDQEANIFSFSLNSTYKYYVRAIDGEQAFINIRPSASIQLPNIEVQDIDFQGNEGMNSIVGETITAERTDNINVMFEYNISTYDTISETLGTGSLTHIDAKAQLNTGTGIGSQYLRSKEVVRYVTGHEVNSEFTTIFATPQVNTIQLQGIGNTQDTVNGVIAPGYSGLDFGIYLRTIEDGLIHIKQDDFNKDKLDGTGESEYTLNPQAENLYKISYGWYGILPIKVSVFCGDELGFVLAHIYDRTNETLTPHLPNPTLPISAFVARLTGTGDNMTLSTSSWRGGIVGKIGASSLIDRIQTVKTVKTVNGVNVPVLSIRNNATFQGKENNVKVRIGTFTPISDGTKSVEFDVYKGGTLTGGLWIAKNVDNSVVDYNNTATSFTPTADILGGTGLAKVDRDRINLVKGDVILSVYPGEELHVVASSPSSNDIILYFRWIEEF